MHVEMLGGRKGWGRGKTTVFEDSLTEAQGGKRFYSLSFCNSAYTLTLVCFLSGFSSSSLLVPLGVLWPPLRPWCGDRRVFLLASRPSRSVGWARLPGLGHGAEKKVTVQEGQSHHINALERGGIFF